MEGYQNFQEKLDIKIQIDRSFLESMGWMMHLKQLSLIRCKELYTTTKKIRLCRWQS